MITDAYLRSGKVTPADDAPYTTTYFDLEQFGSTNQSDYADNALPLDRWATLVVTTSFSECTNMAFDLVMDQAITFNTGPTVIHSRAALGVATLVAGYVIFQVNLAGLVMDRYVTFDNTKGGSAESTGKVELLLATAPITPLNIQKEPS
jgi:hypothetical protein